MRKGAIYGGCSGSCAGEERNRMDVLALFFYLEAKLSFRRVR